MRYPVDGFNVYGLLVELEKLDDAKRCALIDALTLKKITRLYEDPGRSYSSRDALYLAHDESKRNLIKLINLFPKDKRIALISSSFRSESTLVSCDPHHDIFSRFYQRSAEVYLKDFTETVYFENGHYNMLVNMPNFVWTWESFVKSLAMYVKGKNDEQIESAFYDVLAFIPEDSVEQFFQEIGVEKLLSFKTLDSLLEKYKVCETLILNEIDSCIKKLEDVPNVLKKIPPNSLKRFYDKISKTILGLVNDINAFAYVLARFPDRQSSTLQITALINAAPISMGVDTLTTDYNKLVQVVLDLNPRFRLAFLKNLGVIDIIKTGTTPEKQALKNVLRQLLPQSWETAKNQRLEFDDLTRCVASRAATTDAHKGVLGSASGQFETFLKSKGLDVKKPDDWKKNVEMCRVWIPDLLRDCFLRPAWESDREFCQQIHNNSVNKLTLLAETGRYPEAELAMLIVSLAANKPVEADFWLEKFKAWNTWFAWEEYKDNRRVMKGLTVACQEFYERMDFEFNCPTSIKDDGRNKIFRSFVDTMKTILSNMGDADRQRVLDYFKSPAFNCLTDEDMTKYKDAVIIVPAVLPLAVLVKDVPTLVLKGEELLFTPPEEEAPRRGFVGGRAHFFNTRSSQERDMLAIVAGLHVPSNALPVVGAVVEEEEELVPKKKLLV